MRNLKPIILFISFLSFVGLFVACETQNQNIPARDVNDEASLKAFVHSARDYLENDYPQAVVDFRNESRWKYRSIYLFGLRRDGTTTFHIKNSDWEGSKLQIIDAASGEDIIRKLLNAGFSNRGGFVRYRFDNPDKPGKDRSPKISYVVPFRRDGRDDYIVGAGFYPD